MLRYSADFTELLPDDTELSADSKAEAFDTMGVEQTRLLIQSANATAGSKKLDISLMGGLNGEDYLVNAYGLGATTRRSSVIVLEVRVRSKVVGNL